MKKVKIVAKKSKNQTVNPWLNAKDTWRDKFAQLANNHLWLMILTTLSVLIALGCTASAISSANRSSYVPYVIAVDDHGVAVTSGFARQMTKQSDKVVSATLSEFITTTRSVTVDVAYLRKNIEWAYAHIKENSDAQKTINAWYSGSTGVKNPVERAMDEIVNVEIKSILKQTNFTYAIEWLEVTRSRSGDKIKPDMYMKAIVTFEYGAVPNSNDLKGIVNNPLGIYISSFSWAKKV